MATLCKCSLRANGCSMDHYLEEQLSLQTCAQLEKLFLIARSSDSVILDLDNTMMDSPGARRKCCAVLSLKTTLEMKMINFRTRCHSNAKISLLPQNRQIAMLR